MPRKKRTIQRCEYERKYKRENYFRSGLNNLAAGAAAEKLVAYDLYMRGATEVTWPDNPASPDDMYARFPSGWFGVQVKAGAENKSTGAVLVQNRRQSTSHVLAVVSLPSAKVRYLPNMKELPEQLRAIQ